MTDLSSFNNDWYRPGPPLKRLLWYLVNEIFFKTGLFPFYGLKTGLLKLFGARLGHNVLIKPGVNIKYPWLLQTGNNVWIGENAWIDNLAMVTIGDNVCISQGALLLCGNHDYTKPTFDLIVKPIVLEQGCWIGAGATVCGGVVCGAHSVLSVSSVANTHLEPFKIYRGNPSLMIRDRIFK